MPYLRWQYRQLTMKMTMHIDDDLLSSVVRFTGAASKTEAVHLSLREMERRGRLAEFGRTGLGLTPAELLDSVTPGYDILAARDAEAMAGRGQASRLNEDPAPVSTPISYREYARRRRNSRG